MKKILVITVLSVFLFSCNKRYTCKCATTLRRDGYYPRVTETFEEIKKNTSKKKATQICDNTAIQMRANTDLLFPDYIIVSVDCILKDN